MVIILYDNVLTYHFGPQGSFSTTTTTIRQGPEGLKIIAREIGFDMAFVHAIWQLSRTKNAKVAPLDLPAGRIATNREISIDCCQQFFIRGGLSVQPLTAVMLASGLLSFADYAADYQAGEEHYHGRYCARCHGNGSWSRPQTKRSCPRCNGTGLSVVGQAVAALANKIFFTTPQMEELLRHHGYSDTREAIVEGVVIRLNHDWWIRRHKYKYIRNRLLSNQHSLAISATLPAAWAALLNHYVGHDLLPAEYLPPGIQEDTTIDTNKQLRHINLA